MDIKDLITTDPDILGGQPVFTGTRVPVESLFDHLEAGVPLVLYGLLLFTILQKR